MAYGRLKTWSNGSRTGGQLLSRGHDAAMVGQIEVYPGDVKVFQVLWEHLRRRE